MNASDAELQERILVWAIRDDMVSERRDRQAGREPYDAIVRREKLIADWLRSIIRRRVAILVALCALWLLQASAAPLPQGCTESTAAVVLRQGVERAVPSNGTTIRVPAGFAVAWSCVSRAEAEAELARQIASIP